MTAVFQTYLGFGAVTDLLIAIWHNTRTRGEAEGAE